MLLLVTFMTIRTLDSKSMPVWDSFRETRAQPQAMITATDKKA